MLPSAATLHHSNMPFPREDAGVLYMNSSCVQHILKLRGKQMKAKQEGYPESRPLHFPGIFLSCGCRDIAGKCYLKNVCVYKYYIMYSRKQAYRVLYVAYKFLHLTVVHFRR